jgi:hypothetical protein
MAIRPIRRQASQSTIAKVVYHRSIAAQVHAIIEMGYARLIPSEFQHSEEPAITGELVRAMRMATEALDAPSWVRYYSVHDDPPLNTGERQGRRRRRVDIEFERVQFGLRPRFQFEAKRLYEAASVGHYIGQYGLGCFFAEEDAYAQDHAEAGMLGYVQTETEATWASRIQAGLAKSQAAYALRDGGEWQHVRLTPALSYTYCSKHDRLTPQPSLTVFHVFLRFN